MVIYKESFGKVKICYLGHGESLISVKTSLGVVKMAYKANGENIFGIMDFIKENLKKNSY